MAARLVPTAMAPSFSSIGPLAFGPDGVLYAADPRAATIFALDLGAQASSGTQHRGGAKQMSGLPPSSARHRPKSRSSIWHINDQNSFIAVMRGQGATAQPALMRVDGAGKIGMVAFETVKFTNIALPNPAAVSPSGRGGRAIGDRHGAR
jgi:hypothetical protein